MRGEQGEGVSHMRDDYISKMAHEQLYIYYKIVQKAQIKNDKPK